MIYVISKYINKRQYFWNRHVDGWVRWVSFATAYKTEEDAKQDLQPESEILKFASK